MATWDSDPFASDEALQLVHAVRDILDRALDPLRNDHHDTGGPTVIELANHAGALIGALGQQGIDVRPPGANMLAAARADRLNAISKAALVSEPARSRSGFPGERAAERWLRECGVGYAHWQQAAVHGDDLGAAWRALDDAEELMRVARACGGSDERLMSALTEVLAERPDIPALARTDVSELARRVPDLAARLRPLLEPIVEARLAIH